MSRQPYTVAQLRACLAAAEARYTTASVGAEARGWLNAQHALRARISFTEAMEKIK